MQHVSLISSEDEEDGQVSVPRENVENINLDSNDFLNIDEDLNLEDLMKQKV